jgi:hypothetical protein
MSKWKYKDIYIEEFINNDEDGDSYGDGWIDNYSNYWDSLTDFCDDQDDYGWELVTMGWTENSYNDEYDGYRCVFRKKRH